MNSVVIEFMECNFGRFRLPSILHMQKKRFFFRGRCRFSFDFFLAGISSILMSVGTRRDTKIETAIQ